MQLLKKSEFQEFNPGEIIFHQGDFGNYMYVIIKGAVNIRRISQMKNEHLQNLVVNTLYDGEIFGELAMMGTTQKKEKNSKDLWKSIKENDEEIEKKEKENRDIDEDMKKKENKEYIERTKRMATTEAAESTTLLAISRDYFKTILLSTTQKELDDKLNFLMNIPGFSVDFLIIYKFNVFIDFFFF